MPALAGNLHVVLAGILANLPAIVLAGGYFTQAGNVLAFVLICVGHKSFLSESELMYSYLPDIPLASVSESLITQFLNAVCRTSVER
jgi:hypothetical protein